jgi:hypothetical protein
MRMVRAHVIPIPHILKAIIAVTNHVRSNFLQKNVKNFPCSHAWLPQEHANPSAGVIYINGVLACDAWEVFGDRGGKQVR